MTLPRIAWCLLVILGSAPPAFAQGPPPSPPNPSADECGGSLAFLTTPWLTLLSGSAAGSQAPIIFMAGEAPSSASLPPATTGSGGEGAAGGQAGEGSGGADNGTDPTAFKRRLSIYNEYSKLRDGTAIDVAHTEISFPVLKADDGSYKGLLKINIPLVFADVKEPPIGDASGLSDIYFRFAYTPPKIGESIKPIVGMDFFFPSAANDVIFNITASRFIDLPLGTGKFELVPWGGFVYAPSPNFLFAPLYFDAFAVGGRRDVPGVHIGLWRLFVMYAWSNGIYVLPEMQIITNYRTGDSDFFPRFELGKAFKDGTTFYVKPGVGIDPDAQNRTWGIEFGVKCVF